MDLKQTKKKTGKYWAWLLWQNVVFQDGHNSNSGTTWSSKTAELSQQEGTHSGVYVPQLEPPTQWVKVAMPSFLRPPRHAEARPQVGTVANSPSLFKLSPPKHQIQWWTSLHIIKCLFKLFQPQHLIPTFKSSQLKPQPSHSWKNHPCCALLESPSQQNP